MINLYNFLIQLYALAIRIAALFNPKARLWWDGRKALISKLAIAFSNNTHPVVWFHCASLGEFEQARPVIESFKKHFPTFKILLTFFSPSGYEIRKNYQGADYIFYLPLDTDSNAKAFIDIVKPKIALFTKYEFWHHFLHEVKRNQIPCMVFSSIFRKDQLFFKPYGKFYKNLLLCFDKIFVQDQNSMDILEQHGINHAAIAGDTRFDRVLQITSDKKEITIATYFKGSSRLIICGSSWPADMEVILPVLNKIPDIKVIIAPHEIKEDDIVWIEENFNGTSVRFSKASIETARDSRLLIIDNIGMLSGLYQYADVACIGGGFGKGIHNILEAAVYGIPVFFGPNYKKFREAEELINRQGAFSFNNMSDFEHQLLNLMKSENVLIKVKTVNKDYISSNSGATNRITSWCHEVLRKEQ